MKKYLLVAALASVAAGAFGQGQVIFYNRATTGTPAAVVQPIYNVDPTHPNDSKQGAPATSSPNPQPVGTQTYAGSLLEGTGFSAAIWGTLDTTDNSDDVILNDKTRQPLSTVLFRIATTASIRGYWNSVTATVPNVPVDPTLRARFIVRAWDNKGGTLDTWDKALAAWNAGVIAAGESKLFTVNNSLGDGSVSNPNPTLGNSQGLGFGFESFQLYFAVPEPSVIALGVLGAGCLFLLRRRK